MIVYKSYIEKLDKLPSDFVSDAGSEYFDQYEYQEKHGVQTLVKTGSVNRQEEIESFSKSADITNILNRFLNGEVDLLHQSVGTFGDFRNCPTSYGDYFERVRDAKRIFDGLPDDIKDKFDDDPEKFFLEFGTASFLEKVGYKEAPKGSPKESEVVDDAK